MPVYRNKENGTWYVVARYEDWKGDRRQKCKRGFETKREAVQWEHEFQLQNTADMDMSFSLFTDIYKRDIAPRLKPSTRQTKEHIIENKILPYFGNKSISEITSKDVIAWQNEMLVSRDKNGKPYSPRYLKCMHNQLSAIFNHAVRYYDLKSNPAAKAGSMGEKDGGNINFWTKEEYLRFADEMMDKPIFYYAFELLYWCGLRVGELLALTPGDFNFEEGTVRISKSYQRIKRRDVVTTPKTKKSNRTIKMPPFLCEEIRDYLKMLYDPKQTERIFQISKSYLHHELSRGAAAAGVKRIRIHDLRHSHVSLLIDMGFTPVAIAERLGHESIDITLKYAHMFPSKQTEMVEKLERERRN
jgi:integrase